MAAKYKPPREFSLEHANSIHDKCTNMEFNLNNIIMSPKLYELMYLIDKGFVAPVALAFGNILPMVSSIIPPTCGVAESKTCTDQFSVLNTYSNIIGCSGSGKSTIANIWIAKPCQHLSKVPDNPLNHRYEILHGIQLKPILYAS